MTNWGLNNNTSSLIIKNICLIILIVFSFGCSKDNLLVSNYTDMNLPCMDLHYEDGYKYIITSEYELDLVVHDLDNTNSGLACKNAVLDAVDFEEYILLGMKTSLGENDTQHKHVKIDTENKQLIYEIVIDRGQPSGGGGGYGGVKSVKMNWIKISKPPEDFEIIIK